MGGSSLQLVALVPIQHSGVRRLKGHALAQECGGQSGGLPRWCVWFTPLWIGFRVRRSPSGPAVVWRQAVRHNCGIDLHIDESDAHPVLQDCGMVQLLKVLERVRVQSVSLSPAAMLSSLWVLVASSRARQRLCRAHGEAAQLKCGGAAPHQCLVAGASAGRTTPTPLQPSACSDPSGLQRAGVLCGRGGADNVADPWFPAGNFDPMALMASMRCRWHSSLPMAAAGLDAPFTTAPAAIPDGSGLGRSDRCGPEHRRI